MSRARAVGRVLRAASALVSATLWRALRAIGLKRSVHADGVRYTERTAEPLHRAMSASGTGTKEYDATFQPGQRMRLTVTRTRVYADLAEPPATRALRMSEAFVRPGARVLILGGGTGWPGAHLARLVGPSGAVVSLDSDEESVRFAQRRYRLPNVAYELGSVEALKGETDHSFAAVVTLEAETGEHFAELWRLVAPGGALLLISGREQPDPLPQVREIAGPNAETELLEPDDHTRVLAVVKPAG